mmetsp:Transcript_89117/g.238700  ORF Transcript_89117/g.238700 Transcript_89117/m.238700 type:complete len:332 (-) Transcript_89117:829-1824(-)
MPTFVGKAPPQLGQDLLGLRIQRLTLSSVSSYMHVRVDHNSHQKLQSQHVDHNNETPKPDSHQNWAPLSHGLVIELPQQNPEALVDRHGKAGPLLYSNAEKQVTAHSKIEENQAEDEYPVDNIDRADSQGFANQRNPRLPLEPLEKTGQDNQDIPENDNVVGPCVHLHLVHGVEDVGEPAVVLSLGLNVRQRDLLSLPHGNRRHLAGNGDCQRVQSTDLVDDKDPSHDDHQPENNAAPVQDVPHLSEVQQQRPFPCFDLELSELLLEKDKNETEPKEIRKNETEIRVRIANLGSGIGRGLDDSATEKINIDAQHGVQPQFTAKKHRFNPQM